MPGVIVASVHRVCPTPCRVALVVVALVLLGLPLRSHGQWALTARGEFALPDGRLADIVGTGYGLQAGGEYTWRDRVVLSLRGSYYRFTATDAMLDLRPFAAQFSGSLPPGTQIRRLSLDSQGDGEIYALSLGADYLLTRTRLQPFVGVELGWYWMTQRIFEPVITGDVSVPGFPPLPGSFPVSGTTEFENRADDFGLAPTLGLRYAASERLHLSLSAKYLVVLASATQLQGVAVAFDPATTTVTATLDPATSFEAEEGALAGVFVGLGAHLLLGR